MLFKIFLKEKGNLKKIYKKIIVYRKIKNSNLFDKNYYTKKYNINESEINPIYHYMYFGYNEGKNPSRRFHNNYYLKKYPDVKKSGMNPLEHYLLYGEKEKRFINEAVDLENISNIVKENEKKYELLKEKYKKIEFQNQNFYELFDILFVHMDFKSKGTLKHLQDVWIQLLDFVKNICEKHNIEYWLDCGVLLGAIRHKDFIPWDYDLDIGMMRDDLNKFISIIESEIKNNNLEKFILVTRNSSANFLKIKIITDDSINFDLVCLDIFPYDYTEEENINSLTTKYEKIQGEFLNIHKENDQKNDGINI